MMNILGCLSMEFISSLVPLKEHGRSSVRLYITPGVCLLWNVYVYLHNNDPGEHVF